MTEIIPYQDKVIESYQDMESVAKAMVASGFFTDSTKVSQAIVKIMAGREIGLGPFTSMNGIHIIKGKPAFGANVMAAKVKSSGKYNYRVIENNEQGCSIDFYELFNGKWEKVGNSTFTAADGKKAGTQNTDKFARNMYFARAMSNGVRWYCPDVMNGSSVYTPEELGAEVDGDGNVIDIRPVETQIEIHNELLDLQETPEQLTGDDWEDTVLDAVPMTIEAAYKVVGSKGNLYYQESTVALQNIAAALRKRIDKNGLSDEDKASEQYKLDAALLILQERAAGTIN